MPIRNRNQKCRSSEFLFKIATKTENFRNHNQKSIRNQSVSHILACSMYGVPTQYRSRPCYVTMHGPDRAGTPYFDRYHSYVLCIQCKCATKHDMYSRRNVKLGTWTSIWTSISLSFLNRISWNLVSRHIFSRCLGMPNFSSLSSLL